MTTAELTALIEQCRLGLDSELVLLVRLQEIAARQHDQVADIAALQLATDQRDVLTSELMAIERQVAPAHERLTHERIAAPHSPGFNHAVVLRQTIAHLVDDILATDGRSIHALEQIVTARRTAAHEAEQAEATLAAYGRAVAPPPAARLLNRTG